MPAILSAEELAGVYAKLARADETIAHLKSLVRSFLSPASEVLIGKQDIETFEERWQKHGEREVDPAISVVAGEIVHHLRSSLDHIAWSLSSPEYRLRHETAIAFPVFTAEPKSAKEIASYDRKVGGITSSSALDLIKDLQPYKTPNPIDDPIAIVHELNRVDKHHNLVLVDPGFNISFRIPDVRDLVIAGNINAEDAIALITHNMKLDFSLQVVFKKIGKRENQSVVPTLTYLSNAIRKSVDLFGN
jgi:hypothetical protein